MKQSVLFLSNLPKEQKEFLNLLETTAKVHGEIKLPQGSETKPLWDETFHQLHKTDLWNSLSDEKKNTALLSLGQKILQEAYFIECAGMAYAAKMNLTARSKEERSFYCFVAEEEAMHLRIIESLANFNTSLENIPSFALLIGEIIQEAERPSHLLLIQILLEGWGLHYYKTLAKAAKDDNVAAAFKTILKDEIRHHSGGMILFNSYKTGGFEEQDVSQFLVYLERIAFMVKVGPWAVCEEMVKAKPGLKPRELQEFLMQLRAESLTAEKLDVLEKLLAKSLPPAVWALVLEKKILCPMAEAEMTQILSASIL